MKVLFVRSGNNGLDPISQNQGESLSRAHIEMVYFDIIGRGAIGYLKNIFQMRKAIETEMPDIIHAHYSLSGFISTLVFYRKPVVVSLMGSDIKDSNQLGLFIIRIFARFFWSATILKTIKMKDRLKELKTYVIPNGVNLKLFNPIEKETARARLSWANNRKHILFGSDPIRAVKNHNLFKRSIDKLGLEDINFNTHYLKGIERDYVLLHYCAADVLVLTSYSEGSPNVIKEAMACNCPIVSTDVGDVREIISDTEGCYIASFDPEDVCRKIKAALLFGRRTNGRDKIKHLSDEIIARKLINIYEEVIADTR